MVSHGRLRVDARVEDNGVDRKIQELEDDIEALNRVIRGDPNIYSKGLVQTVGDLKTEVVEIKVERAREKSEREADEARRQGQMDVLRWSRNVAFYLTGGSLIGTAVALYLAFGGSNP